MASREIQTPADRPPRGEGSGHVPLRSCVGCRRKRPKQELIRLAVDPLGTVILDAPARAPGRGAYLCRDNGVECLKAARRRRSLSRSLRVGENVIDPEVLSDQLAGLVKEEPSSPPP
ncbi:MAG TPA: YlxR family protein [Candidatus Binatia bacterium]|nr:YlxR family protein [Candidatus Binatia bacterium]